MYLLNTYVVAVTHSQSNSFGKRAVSQLTIPINSKTVTDESTSDGLKVNFDDDDDDATKYTLSLSPNCTACVPACLLYSILQSTALYLADANADEKAFFVLLALVVDEDEHVGVGRFRGDKPEPNESACVRRNFDARLRHFHQLRVARPDQEDARRVPFVGVRNALRRMPGRREGMGEDVAMDEEEMEETEGESAHTHANAHDAPLQRRDAQELRR